MFLTEGTVTILIGLVTPLYFVDAPRHAAWLSHDEKKLLLADLEQDRAQADSPRPAAPIPNRPFGARVWAAAGVYFSLMAAAYGVMFWLPQVIKQILKRTLTYSTGKIKSTSSI